MDTEQLKRIVESCHLNFLIGSGASRPYLDTLGTIEQLLTELHRADIDSDKKIVIEASIKKHYFDVAIKGNLDLLHNIENDNMRETCSAYTSFINSVYAILHKRKTNLITKQANLFTTNMDLFFEKTIEENQLAYNDGFAGRINPKFGTENFHNIIRKVSTHYEYQSEVPLFNIFKLHGSVNWKLNDENKIEHDQELRVLNKITELNYTNNTFMNVVCADCKQLETLANLSDKYDSYFGNITDEHKNFVQAFNDIVMINPTKEKFSITTKDLTFYELLRMYSNHLERENSVLFVIGFSFADEHILEITKRVSRANPTLTIIIFAHTTNAKESIAKLLPERNNIQIISPEKDEKEYTLNYVTEKYFEPIWNQEKKDTVSTLEEKENEHGN